tara:strand:- start:382 stop:501 length:120 start_codon:yes stop_codon:yes gene_type:complete
MSVKEIETYNNHNEEIDSIFKNLMDELGPRYSQLDSSFK